jgi:hypothetical protein
MHWLPVRREPRYRAIHACDRELAWPCRPVQSYKVAAAFGGLPAGTIGSVWQSWTCRGGVQCGSSAGQRLADKPPTSAWRNAQLRGSCDRLDGRRMGVLFAARKSGYNDLARRTLRSARRISCLLVAVPILQGDAPEREWRGAQRRSRREPRRLAVLPISGLDDFRLAGENRSSISV